MKKIQKGVRREVLRDIFGKEGADQLFHKPPADRGDKRYMKKMTRIFVWPNITYRVEEIERDSYVQTIYRMISELSKIRDDLWWDLVMPRCGVKFKLFDEFDNVDVAYIAWPKYIQSTRGHFDKFSLNHSFVEIDHNFKGDNTWRAKSYDPLVIGNSEDPMESMKEIEQLQYNGLRTERDRDRNRKLGRTIEQNKKDDIQWEYYETDVNWNYKDIDLIFSHLPETTWNLLNYFGNEWHHTPPVLGYSHWFDLKDVCNWQYPAFQRECEGITLMKKCYVNTESQKQLVLKEAREIFRDKVVNKLDEKIVPFHLPVLDEYVKDGVNENPNISSYGEGQDGEIVEQNKKLIVFNHRTKIYKDFKNFILHVCDPLWEKRKDFRVWIPLLDVSTIKELGGKTWTQRKEEYLDDLDYKGSTTSQDEDKAKEMYLRRLHEECTVGFAPKQTYEGWSVASTDGMMKGVPYIMWDSDCYRELNPNADFVSSYEETVDMLGKYLDDLDYRNKNAHIQYNHIKDNLLWSTKSEQLSDDIDEVVESVKPANQHLDGMQNLIERIKEQQEIHGECSKKRLIRQFWGNGIKFAPYRRALMEHPNVRDKRSRISTYVWDTVENWKKYDEKNKKK